MFRLGQEVAGQGCGWGENIAGREKSRYASHTGPGGALGQSLRYHQALPCADRMEQMHHSRWASGLAHAGVRISAA